MHVYFYKGIMYSTTDHEQIMNQAPYITDNMGLEQQCSG